uniref:Uncharacterized protein n=1 Tax=Daphnia galeata TaxID=27404 RepID=A0A8J2RCA9_9CRUS|nr:unnamed protein product [Daphnia galeata]
MARLIFLIVLSVSVLIVTVAVDEKEELLDLMSCLFIKKGCDDAKVAKLQMKVAAIIATMDDKEASSLGGNSNKLRPAGNGQDQPSDEKNKNI